MGLDLGDLPRGVKLVHPPVHVRLLPQRGHREGPQPEVLQRGIHVGLLTRNVGVGQEAWDHRHVDHLGNRLPLQPALRRKALLLEVAVVIVANALLIVLHLLPGEGVLGLAVSVRPHKVVARLLRQPPLRRDTIQAPLLPLRVRRLEVLPVRQVLLLKLLQPHHSVVLVVNLDAVSVPLQQNPQVQVSQRGSHGQQLRCVAGLRQLVEDLIRGAQHGAQEAPLLVGLRTHVLPQRVLQRPELRLPLLQLEPQDRGVDQLLHLVHNGLPDVLLLAGRPEHLQEQRHEAPDDRNAVKNVRHKGLQPLIPFLWNINFKGKATQAASDELTTGLFRHRLLLLARQDVAQPGLPRRWPRVSAAGPVRGVPRGDV
eukprot:RCo002050